MNAAEAATMLTQTRAKANAALARAKQKSFAAGKKMAQAAHAPKDFRSQAQAALLARDAYWQRIGAEGEKYRATYLLLAAKERQTAAEALQNIKGARDNRYTIERARSFTARANILEAAGEAAAKAVQHVPEPEIVSLRRANRLTMGADNRSPQVAQRTEFGVNSKLYSPMMSWLYPQSVVQAAGGLSGLGHVGVTSDGSGGVSFIDSLKRAFGIGISEAGKAATKAGADVARENPGTAAVAGAAGGTLAAIASMLGVQFDAGYGNGQGYDVAGERKFPWGAVGAVAAVGAVGFLIWKAR